MNTIAWLAILTAALLIRGVSKGRVTELPGDLRDMMLGALTGDFEAVREAAGRTGDGLVPPVVSVPETGEAAGAAAGAAAGTVKGVALLEEAHRIGDGKPYKWAGTFANGGGGDCSGLVWRAMKNEGIYTGPRFTTVTFPAQCRSIVRVVTDPQVGDIAVWDRSGVTGHMGIVSGPDRFFSALSAKLGVRETSISGTSGKLTFYRLR